MKRVLAIIKSLLGNLIGSLDHSEKGFSQKKVIGYAFAIMVAFIHLSLWRYQFRVGNFSNLDYVLGADLTFLCACLGINMAHETSIMKNGNSIVTEDKDSTQSSSNG